jgi:hypothetical protein
MTALKPMFGNGATDGNLVALQTTSTTLHTAIAGSDHIDEVFVYLCNIHTADLEVVIEIDGTGAGSQCVVNVPFDDGFHLVVPGIRMNNGGTVKAKCATNADVINAMVSVNGYRDPETAS